MKTYKLNPNQVIEFFQSKGLHPESAVLTPISAEWDGKRKGLCLEIMFSEEEADIAHDLCIQIKSEFDAFLHEGWPSFYLEYENWPEVVFETLFIVSTDHSPLNPILIIEL